MVRCNIKLSLQRQLYTPILHTLQAKRCAFTPAKVAFTERTKAKNPTNLFRAAISPGMSAMTEEKRSVCVGRTQ